MRRKILGYLQLVRPAYLPTVAADSLAGLMLGGMIYIANFHGMPPPMSYELKAILLIPFVSILLYAGGLVFNDVFDATVDGVKRPERPIPSGMVSKNNATIFGALLLISGILLAYYISIESFIIAACIAVAVLLYDSFSKHSVFLGPLNMGICRGLNLLLGMWFYGTPEFLYLVFLPVLYIFAITMISQGEVHGGNKAHLMIAGSLYAVVCGILIWFIASFDQLKFAFPFFIYFIYNIYSPLIKAYKENTPCNIKKAVVRGVVSIIIMDALLAIGPMQKDFWWYPLIIIALLPLSLLLKHTFAVT